MKRLMSVAAVVLCVFALSGCRSPVKKTAKVAAKGAKASVKATAEGAKATGKAVKGAAGAVIGD